MRGRPPPIGSLFSLGIDVGFERKAQASVTTSHLKRAFSEEQLRMVGAAPKPAPIKAAPGAPATKTSPQEK